MQGLRNREAGVVRARPTRFAVTGCLFALAWTLLAAAPAAAALPTHTVVVTSSHTWTNTGLDVRPGQLVEINATGTITYAHGLRTGPQGIPWGADCTRVLHTPTTRANWPAPGLPCWSLIGRIGNGTAFPVGSHATVKPVRAGRLYLGVNDNYYPDNQGAWRATLRVTSTNASGAAAHSSSSATGLVIAVVAVVVLLAGLVAALLLGRRRRTRAVAEELVIAREPVSADAAAAAAVPTDDDHTIVPDETDVAHVNIFEVGLAAALLRVGYNHFPEGVHVNWRIAQGRATRATGSFVTQGGGETEHYVSFPVELPSGTHHKDTTVHFRWTINDVPFTYAARPSEADVTAD